MDKVLIREAIDSLELVDIHLYTTTVDRFQEISDIDYPDDMFQQNKLAVSAQFLESIKDENDRFINAKVEFGLRFVEEDEEGDISAYAEIEACFIAKYRQLKDASEECISEFMKYNVVHNVWPFWREHAFRIAAQAKLPTPMISLYKEQPTPKEMPNK